MAVNVSVPAIRSAAWNVTRVIFLLLIVSRIYALLIHFGLVPDYPDPILAFIARTYNRFNIFLEGTEPQLSNAKSAAVERSLKERIQEVGLVSLLIGNVVYACMLRYYSPPTPPPAASPSTTTNATDLSKKQLKKQQGSGSLLKDIQTQTQAKAQKAAPTPQEKAARSALVRRNIIIVGRLSQCVVFLYSGLKNFRQVSLVRPVLDLAVSGGITIAELNGLVWDGGLFDAIFERNAVDDWAPVEKKDGAKQEDGGAKLKLR